MTRTNNMNRFLKFISLFLFLILLWYVCLPNPEFPKPPTDAVQSMEPADTESPMRRAYFTNLTREEVITHYKKEFNEDYKIYTPRLNYPPEESATIIRDQTRSTFLEELVHPMRESLYINGFEPKSEKDTIIIDNVRWRQKIIVKYIPSTLPLRVAALALTFVVTLFLIENWKKIKS